MRDKKLKARTGGGERDDTCGHGLSRSWKVEVYPRSWKVEGPKATHLRKQTESTYVVACVAVEWHPVAVATPMAPTAAATGIMLVLPTDGRVDIAHVRVCRWLS